VEKVVQFASFAEGQQAHNANNDLDDHEPEDKALKRMSDFGNYNKLTYMNRNVPQTFVIVGVQVLRLVQSEYHIEVLICNKVS
jgi:hypothetical protein